MVYIPDGHEVEVNLKKLSGRAIKAWWFNTAAGRALDAGTFKKSAHRIFTPPTQQTDWVLVLDDVAYGFREPGFLP
jgi:hypothetical protein